MNTDQIDYFFVAIIFIFGYAISLMVTMLALIPFSEFKYIGDSIAILGFIFLLGIVLFFGLVYFLSQFKVVRRK